MRKFITIAMLALLLSPAAFAGIIFSNVQTGQITVDPDDGNGNPAQTTVSLFNPFLPPGSGSIEDLNVDMQIISTGGGGDNCWTDLDMDLLHVDTGTSVRLFNNTVGDTCGFSSFDALFDDEASVSIQSLQTGQDVSGPVIPFASLSAFDGESWGGQWNFIFTDVTQFNDESLLVQWSLHATVPEPGTIVLLGLGLLGFVAGQRRRI